MSCILSQTFLTKKPIYNLVLEIYANSPMCVCVFFFEEIEPEKVKFFRPI